MDPPDTSSPPS